MVVPQMTLTAAFAYQTRGSASACLPACFSTMISEGREMWWRKDKSLNFVLDFKFSH